MKTFQKLIFPTMIILTGLFIISCNRDSKTDKDQKKNNYNSTDTIHSNQENPLLLEFQNFVDTLDSTDASSALIATEKYKSVFAGQSQGICDSAFLIYMNLTDTLQLRLNEILDNDTTDFEAFINGEKIEGKIADYKNSLLENGFNLTSSEGVVYIDLNYNFLIQNFSAFVSDPMKAYLSEISQENKEGFARDGAIIISPEKLIDRIIWYENFINQNPKFVLINNCKNYRKAYFSYLLNGYSKTTIYTDSESKELSKYFKTAFDYLIKKYPDTETANLTLPYYEALKQKQQSSANDILKKYVIKGLIFNVN